MLSKNDCDHNWKQIYCIMLIIPFILNGCFFCRLEIAIITFSRTIDWHGFYGYWGLYRRLFSNTERRWLAWRLGSENVFFDPCMAVDHYVLDMSNTEERIIVEKLVKIFEYFTQRLETNIYFFCCHHFHRLSLLLLSLGKIVLTLC